MIKASRRQLIQQMGAWPLLWPLLREGRAEAQTKPKRAIVIYSPNGPIMELGPATGTETNFKLHEWWSPLERHRDVGNFFVGLHQAGVPFGEHNEYGHQSGGTGALTARTTEKTNNSTGPSLDQFIGQALQSANMSTPKRSLLFGLHNSAGNWGPWYESAGKPIAPEMDPFKALAAIAPSLRGDSVSIVDKKLTRKHFVLDAIYKDCKGLTSNLGAEGKAILDYHCNNIESLEKSVASSLATQASQTVNCSAPAKPNTTLTAASNFSAADNRDESMKAFTSLISLAFTCDITRMVGVSFGDTASRFAIPASYKVPSADKVDSGDSGPQHHAWTHTYNSGPDKRLALKTFYTWYSEQVAKLLDELKKTLDADGKPLMDSTLVFWTSELGHRPDNNSLEPHPNDNIPVMLFGNSGGTFKTNRMFAATGNNEQRALVLHQMMVSIIQHTGLSNINTFGNKGTGPLAWLRG